MSAWETLEVMLKTDPRDVACAETFALIHAYAQLLVDGGDPELQMPGVSTHLATCGPCAEDYQGLLAAIRIEAETTAETGV